jgi:hypothetical protein
MTETPPDPVQVLAEVLMDATKTYPELHGRLKEHQSEVADAVMTAIRANTEPGAELRTALGVEVTHTTRVGKNLRAAMDAFSEQGKA